MTDTGLLHERRPSHYYPARATDAVIVRRDAAGTTEHEEFLFYRGVGRFGLPVTATMHGNTLAFTDPAGRLAWLVHSKAGKVGFVAVEGGVAAVPEATGEPASLLAALRERLVASGLYEREADAMIATWRDDWLEDDGVRVFFLVDDETVATRLPLSITPAPDDVVRTIVGRIELLAEERRLAAQRVVDAARSDAAACTAVAKRHGRFAEPLALDLVGPRADAVRSCLAARIER